MPDWAGKSAPNLATLHPSPTTDRNNVIITAAHYWVTGWTGPHIGRPFARLKTIEKYYFSEVQSFIVLGGEKAQASGFH